MTVPPRPGGSAASGGDSEQLRPSGLGPLGDVQLLAAMIGRDRSDLASYVSVLAGSLADALPPGFWCAMW